jgi:hypothetical protein
MDLLGQPAPLGRTWTIAVFKGADRVIIFIENQGLDKPLPNKNLVFSKYNF